MTLTNLPAQLTSFVGRRQELLEVKRLVVSSRLVTLTGASGCGKTRLAVQVASALSETFADGVWLVELAALHDAALVPDFVAQALDVHQFQNQPLVELLFSFVRSKHMLLVLDNCEHLSAACAELAQTLLSHSSRLNILATSREPLTVLGELLYPVSPLALPPGLASNLAPGTRTSAPSLEDVSGYDAIQLFVERARAILPEFALTPKNAAPILNICRRLDGIPLAIELASARANVLTMEQLAERLRDRFALLTAGQRTTRVPHHHTMRAAVDWSYDLLTPEEQCLLQRLATFAAGFTLSTAESVCGWGKLQPAEVLALLGSLVNKSLVVAETLQGSEARYRILEIIRQYAQEKLAASGAWAETHDYYLDCYVRVAEEVAPKLSERYQQTWFNWLEAEHDNLRAALTWALEAERGEAGVRIVTALYMFWVARGYVREAFKWFERFHSRSDDSIPLAVRVNALVYASFLAMLIGYVSAATDWSQQAMALCEATEDVDKQLLGLALAGAASAASTAGDHRTAYVIAERYIALVGESSGPLSYGLALLNSGKAATILGEYEVAHARLDEAMNNARQSDDPYRVAWTLNAMGDLARCERQFIQASSVYEQSLSIYRDLGAAQDIPSTERHLAYVVLRQGDVQRAHVLFRQSLEVQCTQENRTGILRGLLGMATLAVAEGLAEAGALLHGFVFNDSEAIKVTYDSGDWADALDDEHYADTVRAQLGEAAFEAAQLQGSAMSLEQATEYALSLPFAATASAKEADLPSHELTSREREVAALIAQGLSNGEIADELVLSKRTVEKHIANILSELGLSSRAQIVRWAIEQGLLKDSPSP